MTSPAAGQTFPVGTPVTMEAVPTSAVDPIARVAFYLNGTLLEADTSAPYAITRSNLAAGTFQRIQARAVTTTDKRAVSNVRAITIGNCTGGGTVTSAPAGITCTGASKTCTATFPTGTVVTLTQAATNGHTFSGWGGACTGVGGCVVKAGPGRLVAATFGGAPSYQYYHQDAVGSVRAITDEAGNVVARHDYEPFGEEGVVVGDRIGFGGKELDGESAQHYFGARYYRNVTGRFTSVDPVMDTDAALLNPQRWNRYAYALNSPLKFVDPDGKEPITTMVVAGAVVFGGWQVIQNLRNGRPWHENIGVEVAKGWLVGLTMGVAAPAAMSASVADISLAAPTAVASSRIVGTAREARVADLAGGVVAGDMPIVLPNVGRTAVDVIGRSGELVGVGGPAKAFNLGELGSRLKIMSEVADKLGVRAQYYFERGTPIEAIRLARKWLGDDNVFEFDLLP